MRRLSLLISLLTFFSLFSYGQDKEKGEFTLSGEIRPRYEMRNGYGSLLTNDQDMAQFISQRSRLNAFYQQSDIKVYLSIQDVSVWGDRPTLDNNGDNHLGINEAWASYNMNDYFSFKVGRQIISYDDQRIFGATDWAQQSRSFDAFLFQLNKNGWKADLGLAYNQTSELSVDVPYPYTNKSMQYVWANKKTERINLSLLFLNNGTQLSTDADLHVRYSQTYGVFFSNVNKTYWDFGMAVYGQSGKDVNNTSISAWYAAMHAKASFSQNFKAGLGFELLSGTDQDETDGKNHSFNPIYGTNHKFNGFMDYFYVGGRHSNNVGLQDYYATIDYNKNKFGCSLTGHAFNSNGNIYDMNGEEMKSYLGFELDFTLVYKVSDIFKIQGGYSHLFASDSMVDLQSGGITAGYEDNAGWAWLMFAFTPKFLSL